MHNFEVWSLFWRVIWLKKLNFVRHKICFNEIHVIKNIQVAS